MFKKSRLALIAVLFVIAGNVSVAGATTSHHHNPHPIWYAPLVGLPRPVLARTECVLWRESRSTLAHPNLGDNNGTVPGQSGLFQMNNAPGGVWDVYVWPKLHVVIWRASAYQQAQGFVIVWRHDGFAPWHPFDGC